MRIVLLGDSHLARIRRDLALLGPDVTNLAVGGATAEDVLGQVDGVALDREVVAVLSVGTNDARRGVPPAACADAVAAARAASGCAWVYLRPPLVEHSAWGDAVASAINGVVVDTPGLLAGLGSEAFAADELHLSGAGYAVLVPALVGAVSGWA